MKQLFCTLVAGLLSVAVAQACIVVIAWDKEQVLVVELTDPTPTARYPVYRDQIERHPNVISVTAANGMPGGLTQQIRIRPQDLGTDDFWFADWFATDFRFVETMGIQMAAGRPLQSEYSSDSTQAVVINRTAAAAMAAGILATTSSTAAPPSDTSIGTGTRF